MTATPTLGYPSQKDAIIALYDEGNDPLDIAETVGTSINSVHRVLSQLRKRRGLSVVPKRRKPARMTLAVEAWPKTAHDWRMLNYRRSVSAAREALEGIGL